MSWITGYDAAGVVVDSLHADTEPVLHVVHPRTTRWNELAGYYAQQLDLPIVPYAEWFAALEEAQHALQSGSMDAATVEKTLRDNPALRLVDLFRAGKDQEKHENYEPPGITRLSTEKAFSVSGSLRNAESMNEENVKQWISAWKKSGFI